MTVHHRRKLRVSSMLIFFDRPSVPNEKEINHGMVSWQTITITLLGVNNGTSTNDVDVRMRLMLGDTNANGVVNASDVSQVAIRASGHEFELPHRCGSQWDD